MVGRDVGAGLARQHGEGFADARILAHDILDRLDERAHGHELGDFLIEFVLEGVDGIFEAGQCN
jgi:hypothetical protein